MKSVLIIAILSVALIGSASSASADETAFVQGFLRGVETTQEAQAVMFCMLNSPSAMNYVSEGMALFQKKGFLNEIKGAWYFFELLKSMPADLKSCNISMVETPVNQKMVNGL